MFIVMHKQRLVLISTATYYTTYYTTYCTTYYAIYYVTDSRGGQILASLDS